MGKTLIWIASKNGKRFIGHKVRADCTFSLPLPPTRMAQLDFLDKTMSRMWFSDDASKVERQKVESTRCLLPELLR